jgi:hypothetical protein
MAKKQCSCKEALPMDETYLKGERLKTFTTKSLKGEKEK